MKDCKTFIRNNKDFLRNVWEFGFVQDYLLADNAITYFMEGEWESSGGSYYMNFTPSGSNTTCSHNIYGRNSGVTYSYYDIQDKTLVYLNANLDVVLNVYKFTFDGFDTVRVYCYKDQKTYTLYR